MSLKSLFILTSNGDVLIEKHWRGLVSRSVADHFWSEVTHATSHEEVPPVLPHAKGSLVHIQHKGLFFLAVVQVCLESACGRPLPPF
jgi:AP-3 complex subunit mu